MEIESSSGENPKQENQKYWSTYKRAQVLCKQAAHDEIRDLPGFVDFCQGSDDDRILRLENPRDQELFQGPLFGIAEYPGFVFLPRALSEETQTKLALEAVKDFCESPHATNIDLVQPKESEELNRPHETMWFLWKAENGFVKEQEEVLDDEKSAKREKKKYYRTFQKLSWATTGYHYDWSERSYHEGAKSFMPESLQKLAVFFARTALSIGSVSSADTAATTFTPTASIVNYYNKKSVMGGHRDDLEYALDKPVVSINLGLPAIFLLGGKTKESSPVLPILVRPGDVLILGGDSRLNFHGMAKVMPADFDFAAAAATAEGNAVPKPEEKITPERMVGWNGAGWNNEVVDREHPPHPEDLEALSLFLRQHRININVRQVHKD